MERKKPGSRSSFARIKHQLKLRLTRLPLADLFSCSRYRPVSDHQDLDAIYEIVASRNPEIRGHKPEELVDASFVAELDKSGFIKKLYEQK